MSSIFNSLNIGYSGLNVAQVGIDVTAHNVSNAESDGYTRQRVVTSARTPIAEFNGAPGNGAKLDMVKRIFDNFVYDRYTDVASNKEYADFKENSLTELSSYFPEIDGVGIKSDMAKYYDSWQSLADNPDNSSVKLALAKQTETLTNHIAQTQDKVSTLQKQLNEQLPVMINEVNDKAKQLASVNKSIANVEKAGLQAANDLRDKRNSLELDLSKLIGAEVTSSNLVSDIHIDTASNTRTEDYTLSINGFNLVDGNSFHPLVISKDTNKFGLYSISYERQDATLVPMEEKLNNGKVGAILDLRGGALDSTSGLPRDGIIQNTISQLDVLAQGIIESTNNIYANSSTTRMNSNMIIMDPSTSIVHSNSNIKNGEFDIILYNVDGEETARRTITINDATTMTGVAGSNSIQSQIEAQGDDNADNKSSNDIDDYIQFNWADYPTGKSALELAVEPKAQSLGYTFSISDKTTDGTLNSGTNFAGAMGLNRFLDGNNAKNISLNNELSDNPTKISDGYGHVAGDNRVALQMVQHQFEKFDFDVGNINYNTTAYGMFDIIATDVGTATNTAISRNETITAQFSATEQEYTSVSKVNIDEEMTNLIKYQTSYGAAAKVITTIDQMMNTLLGIKQ